MPNRIDFIKKELKELDEFLFSAERVWTAKLISGSYGTYNNETFHLNTKIKNSVLDVLKEYKKELEDELDLFYKIIKE